MSAPIQGEATDALARERASLLHRQLRHETADLHRHLDEQLSVLDSRLSIDRYRDVLQVFLGFYGPIEAGLASAAGSAAGVPLRARAALIESDLLALGASRPQIAQLPRCADLPRLRCLEDLAGCIYVLEGACLGGQVIARAVERRLGLGRDSGVSFFIGDGEATPARWRRVLSWLESLPSGGARGEAIVASARATFSALIDWIARRGPF